MSYTPLRKNLRGALLPAFLILCVLISLSAAKTPPTGPDSEYIAALAAADHFLQAWQSGDVESGMALLTSHAKEKVAGEGLDKFFSEPVSAYEIGHGTLLRHGRYEFPVVLASSATKSSHARRRFSSVVIVNTGHNDWAVDKLP